MDELKRLDCWLDPEFSFTLVIPGHVGSQSKYARVYPFANGSTSRLGFNPQAAYGS